MQSSIPFLHAIRAVQTSYFVALLNRTSCRGNVFQMEFSYISTEGGTHTLLYDDYVNVGLCVVLDLGLPRLVVTSGPDTSTYFSPKDDSFYPL